MNAVARVTANLSAPLDQNLLHEALLQLVEWLIVQAGPEQHESVKLWMYHYGKGTS